MEVVGFGCARFATMPSCLAFRPISYYQHGSSACQVVSVQSLSRPIQHTLQLFGGHVWIDQLHPLVPSHACHRQPRSTWKYINVRRSPRVLYWLGLHSEDSNAKLVSHPLYHSFLLLENGRRRTGGFASATSFHSQRCFCAMSTSRSRSGLGASKFVDISVSSDSINSGLLSKIAVLEETYNRPFYLFNRHVETIFAAFFRTLPKLTYKRELLETADGGTVALDWPIGGQDEELWRNEPQMDSPVLILLPGLAGGSGDTYVRHNLIKARKAGWKVVVFNSRGCADSPVTSAQFYSASFTEDLRQVVKRVGNLYPNSRLYAAGWSLGANILVRYLGEEGDNCALAGAVSLCNPFDLIISLGSIRSGFNSIYDRALGRSLATKLVKHAALFESAAKDFDIPLALNAKNLAEFDEGITRRAFGFKSVEDYYSKSSSSLSIKDVRIPLLCIQAEDDPIAPSTAIPRAAIKANLNCALIVTPAGGHLGWVAGPGAPFGAPWTDGVVMEYLNLLQASLQSQTTFESFKGRSADLDLVGVESRSVGGGMPLDEPNIR